MTQNHRIPRVVGLLPLLLLGAVSMLFAEPSTIRFRTLAWEGEIAGVFYAHKGKPVEIMANDSIRSMFYTAEAAPELVFFRLPGDPDDMEAREELGRVAIGQLGSTILVLISKDPAGGLVFSALDDGLESAPTGSYRIFNATKETLSVLAEAERAEVAPAASVVMKPGIELKSTLLQVTQASEPPRLVYSNRLAVRAGQRTLVIAMDSGNPRSPVVVKRIMENIQIAEAAGPEADKN